jgi:hypothetical protein
LSTWSEYAQPGGEDFRDDPSTLVQIGVNLDGRGQLFCGRAAETLRTGQYVIFEILVAGNTASFFAAMAAVYSAAGYHGHVDVGVAVTGIEGAASYHRIESHAFSSDFRYSAPAFTRTARIAAAELQDAEGVTRSLLRHFYEASSGIDGYDPFAS